MVACGNGLWASIAELSLQEERSILILHDAVSLDFKAFSIMMVLFI